MKKLSNEVKVGAAALLTIVLFIWLFNFLKGKDYFKSTLTYYSVYDNIAGLAESSPIEVNGYQVGVVQSIHFLTPESGKLVVQYSVSKDFRLPKGTIAEVLPVSIIAGMKARFIYGTGPGFYKNGDTIPGRIAETFFTELEPLKDKIMKLSTTLDSVISSVNDIMDPEFRKNVKGTIARISSTSESIDRIIGSRETDLKTTIDDLNKFSGMLAANSDKMSKTFSNLNSITDTIEAADIYKSISNLKSALDKTSTLIGNLNQGKGSAGQFITNDTLYKNLNTILGNLNGLLQDIKANPKRYINFSVFGKKNIPEK
ncbi:MAG: MlaD family protein [Bacteroidales bacterium]|jgi:phospholipid/cholesterol/gamma-HCH transport system substrate-binding protein